MLRLNVNRRRRFRGRRLLEEATWTPLFQNLFLVKKLNSPVFTEPMLVVNEEFMPSPPRASVADQLRNTEVPECGAEKAAGVENLETEKPDDIAMDAEKITSPGIADDAEREDC
ncbi:hypothetical protein Hanom_Chr04g00325721 [Helianthus anomalus]